MRDREPSRVPLEILAFVCGVAALVGSAIAYVTQSSESGLGDDPNYAPALLLLGAGAYLILLAVILIAGRRR